MAFIASAVNSFPRNRFQMFNSTSRYLVYCTINRDTKRVTIILRYPRYTVAATLIHVSTGRDRCRLPLFAHCAVTHNEPARFSTDFRILNRGSQCTGYIA